MIWGGQHIPYRKTMSLLAERRFSSSEKLCYNRVHTTMPMQTDSNEGGHAAGRLPAAPGHVTEPQPVAPVY
jgi:hypothetical protein